SAVADGKTARGYKPSQGDCVGGDGYHQTLHKESSQPQRAGPVPHVLVVKWRAQYPGERITDEHRDSKRGDGEPQLSGRRVTSNQSSSDDDSGCNQEDIRYTEQGRLLERLDELDDVDHCKAHEQYDPGCAQDQRGDSARSRVIECPGRWCTGALRLPRKQLRGHGVSLRVWLGVPAVTQWSALTSEIASRVTAWERLRGTRARSQRLTPTASVVSTQRRTTSINSAPLIVSFSRRRSMTDSRDA